MALESPVQRDGDTGFLGFASRLNPLTLPAGMLQDSVNMRLDRGVATTRKGARRLADAISTADEPMTLSFDLADDKAISTITFVTTTATVTTAAAHGYSNGDTVNIRGATGVDEDGNAVHDLAEHRQFEDFVPLIVDDHDLGHAESPVGGVLDRLLDDDLGGAEGLGGDLHGGCLSAP
jgi:hypothetical protein